MGARNAGAAWLGRSCRGRRDGDLAHPFSCAGRLFFAYDVLRLPSGAKAKVHLYLYLLLVYRYLKIYVLAHDGLRLRSAVEAREANAQYI